MPDDPIPEPSAPPPPSDPFPPVKEAQEALQKQVWELAIEKFRAVLREDAAKPEYHLGLGQAYEGKSRDQDGRPFIRLAMEEYRKAIRLDENFQAAHDALLAATLKAGLLEDLFEEYKYKLSKDPQNPLYKGYIKKIETLLILQADRSVQNRDQAGGKWVILERLMAAAGFLCLIGSVIALTFFRSAPWAIGAGDALKWTGFFLIGLYILFKLIRRK